MPIVSISLNKTILDEMDAIEKEMGFSGRSELIRTSIRNMVADKKEKEKLSGHVDAILILLHDENVEAVLDVKHKFDNIIKTQIHNKLKEGKCFEVFVLEGDAKDVKKLHDVFQSNRKIDLAKLIVT